ncbi:MULTISPECIES: GGDEF domain-containing protein [unclassified Streptomyces]|uniref:GGDEF domain-containing protein n=1 Tax=unclassified Streptomyces TaxID=2593676 RepID=UPI00225786C0|nr:MULTISPECIES: GGDEF domain-containing protein [unclassified Streptomyces]MCX4989492.1 GGDEF domain-containing protein [Streptomyces sp. NBC_00568]MCX5005268.1 GGDEF domain-containing protein [Streptomyces sp. NBC_00638]
MNELLFAAAASVPMAAGWSLHASRLARRIESARRDPLTGLWTRDAFTKRAERHLRFRPVAVYLVDLNRFKEINDTHGHAIGDAVIRATGERLAAWAVDHGAVVGRLGGDEFAAMAPVSSHDHLTDTLHRLSEVLETPVETAGLVLDVSASIGAVGADPRTEQVVLSDLLRLADEQMYRARRCEAPWSNALSLEKRCPNVHGRRAGRSGTHGGTRVAA